MTSNSPTIRRMMVSILCAFFLVSALVIRPAEAQETLAPTAERAKARLSGVTCEAQQFCLYKQPGLQGGIASLTVIPRFYHMAVDCYVQAAIIGTKRYYDMTARPGLPFSEAETGFGGEWKLASFCTQEVKDTAGVVLNAHVIANTRLLYVPQTIATSPVAAQESTEQGNALGTDTLLGGLLNLLSPEAETQTRRLVNQNTLNTSTAALHVLLEQYDQRMKATGGDRESSSTVDSPERLVSDILWKEYLSYAQYLTTLRRDPSEVARAELWAQQKVTQTSGSGVWTAFLKDQIESVSRTDAVFDARVAKATRDVADAMYGEFVRTYSEHLQYIILRDNLQKVAVQLDSIERALSTLSVKLKDAFVTGD